MRDDAKHVAGRVDALAAAVGRDKAVDSAGIADMAAGSRNVAASDDHAPCLQAVRASGAVFVAVECNDARDAAAAVAVDDGLGGRFAGSAIVGPVSCREGEEAPVAATKKAMDERGYSVAWD